MRIHRRPTKSQTKLKHALNRENGGNPACLVPKFLLRLSGPGDSTDRVRAASERQRQLLVKLSEGLAPKLILWLANELFIMIESPLLAQCSELLPSLCRQCFYDGDILQQFLRQTVPLL